MAHSLKQFSIHPATPFDFTALTFLSLEAIRTNPFFYLTFPPSVSPEQISQYHFVTKIKQPNDGSVEIMKVVDNSCLPAPKIVGFASWKVFRSEKETKKSDLPKSADSRFLKDFWYRADPLVEKLFDLETDIELNVMRILPAYQGRGLGGMLLRWGLERANHLGKRIFLLSSPEGKYLYAKYGFETVGTVIMDLEKYGGQGTYAQTAMIWNESKQGNKIGI
ncbi:hypothetical protein N431DRAFT_353757 [Stipitochalara longipes BDJ]|nr:hypothetical protein N431DRAFT_353757 [Stipitochalara longipes BDJ]